MSDVTVFGFQRSTYVNVVRLVLTEKGVPFRFHDTEDEMYTAEHLKRHPFGRVPALQHDDFMLYETRAIVSYVDEVLDGPKLTPAEPRQPHWQRYWPMLLQQRQRRWLCQAWRSSLVDSQRRRTPMPRTALAPKQPQPQQQQPWRGVGGRANPR